MPFLKDKILNRQPDYGEIQDWLILLIGKSIRIRDELYIYGLQIDDIHR
jgi:hypothetical protein